MAMLVDQRVNPIKIPLKPIKNPIKSHKTIPLKSIKNELFLCLPDGTFQQMVVFHGIPWQLFTKVCLALSGATRLGHLDAAGCVGVGGVTAAWKKRYGLCIDLVGLRCIACHRKTHRKMVV